MTHPALAALARLRDPAHSTPHDRAHDAWIVLGWIDAGWDVPNSKPHVVGGAERAKFFARRDCFAAL